VLEVGKSAVFAFKDERPATLDIFTMHVVGEGSSLLHGAGPGEQKLELSPTHGIESTVDSPSLTIALCLSRAQR
jgi:hypothetical protein